MNNRRDFLKLLTAAIGTGAAGVADIRADVAPRFTGAPAAAFPAVSAIQTSASIKKSTLISMLPRDKSYAERFALAKAVGFEGIEMRTVTRDEEAAEIREASQKTGLKIHSVMNAEHWNSPLSSSDPEVVTKSVKGMETSFRNAALWGADTVLLVPAVVDAKTSYQDAWTRSQRVIRERLLPLAKEMKVIIGVEEVWNKFLLSPIEFARYVDDFQSPWVRAYFDVGNILIWAFPQDWIRTLGRRIVKVHLKDFAFERGKGQFFWRNIGEGDIDWQEVRKALGEVGYTGYVTTELDRGDEAYLKDVSERVDRFLAGEKPFVKT